MNNQEKTRERLKRLLCNVKCPGPDRREGGCRLRECERCRDIEKLDFCMINLIAEALIAEGVTFLEDATNED